MSLNSDKNDLAVGLCGCNAKKTLSLPLRRMLPVLALGAALLLSLSGCREDEPVALGCPLSYTAETEGNGRGPACRTSRESLNLDSSFLQFIIDTNCRKIVDEPKISASLLVTENSENIYNGFVGIEYRGATSQLFDKKSYGIETWDASGNDVDASLAGLPEEEDWVLHGPYADKTLIRNALIYRLANQIGQYASRSRFLELSISNEFLGVYVLLEKIKRDKNRVNIKKLESDDNVPDRITGGYIIKIDNSTGNSKNGRAFNDKISFRSNYDLFGKATESNYVNFLYHYPKPDDISSQQKLYIQSYMHDFETALASENFTSSTTGYKKHIDVDTFVDHFILIELSKDGDGYGTSTYMHKDRGGKLKMGPIWDFNSAFSNTKYYCSLGHQPDKWVYRKNYHPCLAHIAPNDLGWSPFWWPRLLEDPDFVKKLKSRWALLRRNELSKENIFGVIDSMVSELEAAGAIKRNFEKWDILDKCITHNPFIARSHEREIAHLKDWLAKRLDWLDSNISTL